MPLVIVACVRNTDLGIKDFFISKASPPNYLDDNSLRIMFFSRQLLRKTSNQPQIQLSLYLVYSVNVSYTQTIDKYFLKKYVKDDLNEAL